MLFSYFIKLKNKKKNFFAGHYIYFTILYADEKNAEYSVMNK